MLSHGSAVHDFDFSKRNELLPVFGRDLLPMHSQSCGYIGLYDGRKKGNYTLQNPKNGLFTFVANGAFEFENRLLESRDGLSISRITSVDFEALSENAILLVMEIPL